MTPTRGEIYLAKLDPTIGQEIQKTLPVVIISNNVNNLHSDLVTVIPITSQKLLKLYPFEVLIPEGATGLTKPSKAKANQIRTIDKQRLQKRYGVLDAVTLNNISRAVRIHLDL